MTRKSRVRIADGRPFLQSGSGVNLVGHLFRIQGYVGSNPISLTPDQIEVPLRGFWYRVFYDPRKLQSMADERLKGRR